MQGFIVLHRKMIEWEWFTDVNTSHLFMYCLLKANHENKKWRSINIDRGSFITSLEHISKDTGLSIQNIRTSLNKLKSTNELTCKTTSQYSIISIKNYNLYQDYNTPINKQLTNEQQTTNKRLTTNNNDNNDNNDNNNNIGVKNKIFIVPSIDEIKKYCIERKNNIDAEEFFDYYTSRGWLVGKSKMKDWKAAVRNWERRRRAAPPVISEKPEGYNYGFN